MNEIVSYLDKPKRPIKTFTYEDLLLRYSSYVKEYGVPGIYGITNTTNGKIYIGKSKHVVGRLRYHLKGFINGNAVNSHLKNAIIRHGYQNFKFMFIQKFYYNNNLTKFENDILLHSLESHFMRMTKSNDKEYGYNIINSNILQQVPKRNAPKLNKRRKFSDEDKEDIIDSFISLETPELKDVKEIASRYNCVISYIVKVLVQNDIEILNKEISEFYKEPPNKIPITKEQEIEICSLYSDKNYSPRRIMKKLGISGVAISRILHKNGKRRTWSEAADIRDQSDQDLRRKFLTQEQINTILKLFTENIDNTSDNTLIRKIAFDLKIGWRMVHRTLRENNIIIKENSRRRELTQNDVNRIVEMYTLDKFIINEIANKMNINKGKVAFILKENNVKIVRDAHKRQKREHGRIATETTATL